MNATLGKRVGPLLITTLLVATPVWAQTTGAQPAQPAPQMAPSTDNGATPAGPTSGMPGGMAHKAMPMRGHAAMGRQPGEDMQMMIDRRITDLHSRLHVTAAQDPQWEQFATVMRTNGRAMDEDFRQRAEKLPTMTALDNMQSYAQIDQQRSENAQKLVAAFQTVYGTFSDEQKKAADQLFRNYAEQRHQRHHTGAGKG